MKTRETAVQFDCEGHALFGVLSLPVGGTAGSGTGVVIVVGGPQYRAGSHRQFVLLARYLAARGHAVLRFDYRGMGDSVADGRIGHFEGVESDIAAAVAALHRSVPGLQRTVLWGLCDGASAALLYLQGRRDPRIGGLVAVNPWVRTPAGQARTTVRHYYLRRLLDRSFWRKLISGNVGWSALEGFVRNAGAAVAPDVVGTQGYTQRMAQGWGGLAFTGMLALSEHDFTAREFEVHTGSDPSWRRAFSQRPPLRVYLPGADHTCSQPGAMQALNEATSTYLLRLGEAS